tara:strand:+ start:1927 stop:3213 length:1287 start_codon:yes stop_codon:yes gene_type:complete
MIRILVVNEVSPQKKNRTSILFEKVIPILLKKNEIKVFWLSYDYKKNEKSVDSWYELLHVHEFKNAKEVIEFTKPDLIYVFPGLSIIDYAFLLTARVLKIPTFGFIDGIGVFTQSKGRHVKKVLKIFTNEIFVKKKIDENNSEFRGTSYFKKNLFLIRSMRKIGNSYQHIIIEIIKNFKLYFNYKFQENEKHTRFNCNLLLIENELSVNYACNLGLSKNNIKVVGDPTYDLAFDEKYVEEEIESNRKINVLFITTNFNGGQGELEWSVQKQKQMIKELAEEYEKNKEKISLKIKIHPVSENYKDYEKILDGYNSNIEIFQHQNIFKLIKDADMIICPSASTAGLIALIMKKPIVVWNYFNIQGDVFLKEKITMNCNKISEIKACIDNRIKFIQENEVIIDNYIKKYCGEGNASQKCADAIYELILKSK